MGKLIDTLSFMYGYLCVIGGAVIAYAFGGWTKGLDVLLALIVLDIITGLCASAAESRRNPDDPNVGISSKKYKKGFLNKVWIFVVIGLLHKIDVLLGIDPSISFMTAAIYFYISNELLSLTENFGRIGVPMPSFMQQIITVFKEKGSSTTVSKEKEDEKIDDQTR